MPNGHETIQVKLLLFSCRNSLAFLTFARKNNGQAANDTLFDGDFLFCDGLVHEA